MQPSPFPASVLRSPSPTATCTCEHWVHCDCTCHGRACDPVEQACDVAWLADDGGLVFGGCPRCTPGEGAPHYLGCDLIGWNVPLVYATADGRRVLAGDDPRAIRTALA